MRVQETLDRLGLYWKRDPDFVPVKDAATVRLNVSIGGGGVELLATWPKWYDTRKEQGGGAIDLTMHLFLRALLPCPLPDAGDGDGLAGAGIS